MCSWMKISFEGALEKKLENKGCCRLHIWIFWFLDLLKNKPRSHCDNDPTWPVVSPMPKRQNTKWLQRKSASGHTSCSPSSCQNACMLALFTWVLSGTFKWGSYIPATKTSPLCQSSCRKYLTDSNRCGTSNTCISIILFSSQDLKYHRILLQQLLAQLCFLCTAASNKYCQEKQKTTLQYQQFYIDE